MQYKKYPFRTTSCFFFNRVDEADVLSESHQSGYIFFYLHKDMCSQVV